MNIHIQRDKSKPKSWIACSSEATMIVPTKKNKKIQPICVNCLTINPQPSIAHSSIVQVIYGSQLHEGNSAEGTPRSSAQRSPTVNLIDEYTLATQSKSFSEIWSIIHPSDPSYENPDSGHTDAHCAEQLLAQILNPSREWAHYSLRSFLPRSLRRSLPMWHSLMLQPGVLMFFTMTSTRLIAWLNVYMLALRMISFLFISDWREAEDRHPIHVVAKQLQKNHRNFLSQLKDLEEHICLCFAAINRARSLLLDEIRLYQSHYS
ncbi:hypothetical protein HYC85_015294 [Camellia sinensis]|uniref:Uncharacterized protein n=1 Tax=Camellia sinensis TaxID=4442 RepID=A0A7J7H024_CAMSI|nr:hypothetical protein HYC85_015294 [Camellia sinensis]